MFQAKRVFVASVRMKRRDKRVPKMAVVHTNQRNLTLPLQEIALRPRNANK